MGVWSGAGPGVAGRWGTVGPDPERGCGVSTVGPDPEHWGGMEGGWTQGSLPIPHPPSPSFLPGNLLLLYILSY